MEDMRIEELIDLYGDDILRLCLLYLGDRQLAEEAFQDTNERQYKSLKNLFLLNLKIRCLIK